MTMRGIPICKSLPSRMASCEVRPPTARCEMRVLEVQVEGWSDDDDDQRKSRPCGRSCPCSRRSSVAGGEVELGFGETKRVGIQGGMCCREWGSGSVYPHRSMAFALKRTATTRPGWLTSGANRACIVKVDVLEIAESVSTNINNRGILGKSARSSLEKCDSLTLQQHA
ncbi:unnamed protein product [Triticum turgidum subsp. durum]|uniref:Uncharacterized protein n=1 Tax=Triticum turgidum subsp. durum TaxID=4567 RepID=A0A9R1QBR2_TRITD|nr:unnamed protein product [Triticum turgidum subsp. durum]